MVKDLNDPTNRDSVPAMLTPGEYVVNKEATQMYGDVIHQMNQHGLQQRHMENQMYNIGGKVEKLYNEGYTAPGQAYAIAKSMGYNEGGFVDFLKKHEGWRDKAYDDGTGTWTIGYGRTRNADGSKIKPGQTTTKEAEDAWINQRAAEERSAIDAYAEKYGYDWTPQERDALASFRYNAGQGNLDQLTDNGQRDMATIKEKFGLYNKGGGEFMQGLQNRRNYEMELAGWGNTQPVQGTNMIDFIPGATVPTQEVPAPTQAVPAQQPVDYGGEALASALFRGMGYNQGGGVVPVIPHYNDGGWFQGIKDWWSGGSTPAVDPTAGYANYSQQDFVNEANMVNNPGAQLGGYDVPVIAQPAMPGSMAPPVEPITGNVNTAAPTAIHAGNAFNFDAPSIGEVPSIETATPDAGQSPKQVWNSIKAQRDQWPKGSPERIALSNMMNQINVKSTPQDKLIALQQEAAAVQQPDNFDPRDPNAVPELRAAPPVPGSDEDLLQNSSQSAEQYANLPIGDPRRVAAIENGTLVPTEGDMEWEEQAWRTNEALQQAQLQAAVTAPDAPGAQFIQNRVDALQQQADSLGIPPDVSGVGPNINVGGPNPPPELGGIPNMPLGPNDVGTARPVIDGSVPTPEQVIQNQPQDIWGGMNTLMPAPDQMEQANIQAAETGAPALAAPPEPPVLPEGLAGESIADINAAAQPPENPTSKAQAPVTKDAVAEKVQQLGEPLAQEEAATAETAGKKASPAQIDKAKNIIAENFGDLFDKKELARAAVLFAGAMITGMSPQRALAYAGTNYINRIDAKEAQAIKTQQAAAAAAAKRQPTIDMTQKDEFIVDGKKVNAYKMTTYGPNGEKIHSWVDAKTQQPISPTAHQNFDSTPGTPEYNKRVQAESKQYSGILDEVLSQQSALDQDGNPITGILPKASGPQVAKWAIKNNIPPEAMGQLLQNAGNAAIADSRGGTQARSIEAYLNEQYIESQIGDPSLFAGAQADEVAGLMQDVATRSGLKGSVAQVSTPIIQAALPMWDALSQQEKERYARKAKGTNKSPFMVWMEEDLNS